MNTTTVTVLVAIIAAGATLVTALITFLTVIITKYKERTAAIAQENRQHMIPIYDGILTEIGVILTTYGNGKVPPRNPALTQKVATWASTEVLRWYLLVCEECRNGNAFGNHDLIRMYSELVLAIRNDLGYKKARWTVDVKTHIGAGVLLDYLVKTNDEREVEQQRDRSHRPD